MPVVTVLIRIGLSALLGVFAVLGIWYPTSKLAKKYSEKSKADKDNSESSSNETGRESSEESPEVVEALKEEQETTGTSVDEAVASSEIEDVSTEAETTEKKENSRLKKVLKISYCVVAVIVSALVGVMFVTTYANETDIYCLKRAVIVSILFVAAYYDYKAYRIPNKLIIYGLIMRLVLMFAEVFTDMETFVSTIISEGIAALAVIVLSVVCMLVVKNGLGFGDVKLFILIALLQGVSGMLSAIFASLIISFFYSVFLLITKKKDRKDFIPFAPCILIGTTASVFLMGA